MHRGITTALRLSTLLVVASGFCALVATYVFPAMVLLAPFALFLFMPVAERIDQRVRWYRKVTSGITLIFIILVPLLFVALGLLGTVITLVIYVICYGLAHQKSEREYQYLYLMSFFLLLAACMLSPEPSIGLVMALFLVSLIIALIMLEMEVNARRYAASATGVLVTPQEEIPPAAGTTQWRQTKFPAIVAVIAMASIFLTAALFFSMPRLEAGLLGRGEPAFLKVGRAQRVDIAQGGTIFRDQTPVMQVTFPDEPDGQYNGALFWRCTTLSQFDAPEWTRRNIVGIPSDDTFALWTRRADMNRPSRLERSEFGGRRLVRQIIDIAEVPFDGAPALPLVQKLRVLKGNRDTVLSWDANGDFTVLVNQQGQRWLQYEVISEEESAASGEMERAPDNYRDVIPPRDYAILTETPFSLEMKKVVQDLLEGKNTVYTKVQAVIDYLNSGQFLYSRTVPELPDSHPIEAFLTRTRVGHCQLFASAMALMLRSAGIPARVVSGYRGGEWNSADRTYTVREEMAHMWVEVYFIGLGWMSFDPSPPDDVARSPVSAFRRELSRYILKAKMAWYRNVISFDRRTQMDVLRSVRSGIIGFAVNLFDGWDRFRTDTAPVSLLLSGTTVFALAAAILLTAIRRHMPAALTPDQARAVRLYRVLLNRVAKWGVTPKNRTAEEIVAELRLYPAIHVPAMQIVRTYNQSRFGCCELPPEKAARLSAALRRGIQNEKIARRHDR